MVTINYKILFIQPYIAFKVADNCKSIQAVFLAPKYYFFTTVAMATSSDLILFYQVTSMDVHYNINVSHDSRHHGNHPYLTLYIISNDRNVLQNKPFLWPPDAITRIFPKQCSISKSCKFLHLSCDLKFKWGSQIRFLRNSPSFIITHFGKIPLLPFAECG